MFNLSSIRFRSRKSPATSQSPIADGLALREQGDWPAAIAKFEEALKRQPDCPQSRGLLLRARLDHGIALRKEGRWDAARAAFEAALDVDPQSRPALDQLAQTIVQQGVAARDSGRHDAAVALFQEALQRLSGFEPAIRQWAQTLVAQGVAERAEQRWAVAQARFAQALDLLPGFQPALNHQAQTLVEEGIALRRQGSPDEARARFEDALAVRPDHPPAQQQLAWLYLGLGEDAAAIPWFRAFLRQRPQAFQAGLALARATSRLTRHLETLDAYFLALDAGADDADGIRNAVTNLLYRESGPLLAQLETGALPDDLLLPASELCRRVADSAHTANLVELALAGYRRAMELGAADAGLHKALGNTLVDAGRDAEARTSLEAALALDPTDVEAMTALGLLARHHGDREQALALGRDIEAASPGPGGALLFAAVEAREAGDHAAVTRRFRAAFGWEPPPAGADTWVEEWHRGMRIAHLHDAQLIPLTPRAHAMGVEGGIRWNPHPPEYAHRLVVRPDGRPAMRTRVESLAEAPRAASRLLGTTLYGDVFFNHFGHFMAECPHRLWAWERYRDQVDRLAILRPPPAAPAHPQTGAPRGLLGFQLQALAYLGIDSERVTLIDAPAMAETLLVPEQGSIWGGGPFAPPSGYIDWLGERQQDFFAAYSPERGSYPERLCVTRGHLIHQGGIAGEAYLERLLAEEGFHIFRPERHSLAEQMNHYRHAREIVFTEGSALHGLELMGRLPQSPHIVILSRRMGMRSRWDGLIRARTPHYAFFGGISELPTLGASEALGRLPAAGLSLALDPPALARFVRENSSAQLASFDADRFRKQEAGDIARYLLHCNLPAFGAPQLWAYLHEFRERLMSITRNPYLMPDPDPPLGEVA